MTPTERKRLFVAYLPFLRRVVHDWLTRHRGMAAVLRRHMDDEDAKQDAVTKAWTALPRWDPARLPMTSYLAIVIEKHLWKLARHVGARKRDGRTQSLADGVARRECAREGPPDGRGHDVEVILAAMPPRRAEAVRLLLDGLGTREVAERMGVTATAVSQHLQAALQTLRDPHAAEERLQRRKVQEECCSSREAAAILGVGRTKFLVLAKRGRLTPVWLDGRNVRYRVAEVRALQAAT